MIIFIGNSFIVWLMISISIIIPIYHVEQYARRCLESVMIQAIFNAEIECVVVDDCGLDGSMDIVRQMITCYQGPISFEVVCHEKNKGLSAARNTGLYHAKGDYVFFLDSDDYLMPDSFQYFLENLERYPDIDVVMGNVKNCKGGDLLIKRIENSWLIDDCNVFFSRMLHHQIYLFAWNKLIRRSLLMKHQVFFIEGIIYEDQAWSYKLFSHISSILLLPQVTYVYEYNPQSIVNKSFSPAMADLSVKSWTASVNNMLDNPPEPSRYSCNMTVGYLLFMGYFLMNAADMQLQFPISKGVSRDFLVVRRRLLLRSLRYGRLLLACFFLLLFRPFSYLQRVSLFRRHYYDIESVMNTIAHQTDFMHNKNRI